MTTIIYIATNNTNGHQYVGLTTKKLKLRVYMHVWNATSNSKNARKLPFGFAIKKYGIDNFSIVQVYSFENHEEAQTAERYLIDKLKPEYNVSAGGRGPNGVKWTNERREKTIKGFNASWTDERKIHMSNKNKGVRPSEASLKGSSESKHRDKAIVCMSDGKAFESVKMAAAHYGINANGIYAISCGRQKSTAGLRFELVAA